MLDVIDHSNHPTWTKVYKNLGRENGAATYSRDIVKFYIPVFEKLYGNKKTKVLVMTVTNCWDMTLKDYKKIFLFIHERGINKEARELRLNRMKAFKKANPQAKVYFIVWHPVFAEELKKEGLNAIFLPMAIDTEYFQQYVENPKKYNSRLIYFGNITKTKVREFNKFKRTVNRRGWQLDYISDNKYNGGFFRLKKEKIFWLVSQYKYGVAAGRAAQELSAMGLKVICPGYNTVLIPRTTEEAEDIMNRNCVSWAEDGESLDDFKKWISLQGMRNLKPIHRDCRDMAKTLEQILINGKY